MRMNLNEFLKRFLFHLTVAGLILAALLLLGEKLVPNSVLPFVDVIDALPILLGLLILTVLVHTGDETST
jgi:hypothetical protein